eukprot:scaffold111957_cov47-Phaeocystis_antarctica.AAC.1
MLWAQTLKPRECCGDSGGYPVGCPIETCAWGIASQRGALVLLQSFRSPQFVARGLRSCLSSRDREMATCESCKFRASLASIW